MIVALVVDVHLEMIGSRDDPKWLVCDSGTIHVGGGGGFGGFLRRYVICENVVKIVVKMLLRLRIVESSSRNAHSNSAAIAQK